MDSIQSFPREKYNKLIVTGGNKEHGMPTEQSKCLFTIDDTADEQILTIGCEENAFECELSYLLQKMYIGEISVCNSPSKANFKLHLHHFESPGLIYEWSTETKLKFSNSLKEQGNVLFKENNFRGASYKYSKALKYLHSIPISVADDKNHHRNNFLENGIDIKSVKVILYNNLAQCLYKNKQFHTMFELAMKCLVLDETNTKTLFNLARSQYYLGQFENALKYFLKVQASNPTDSNVANYIKLCQNTLSEDQRKYKEVVKKMFQT